MRVPVVRSRSITVAVLVAMLTLVVAPMAYAGPKSVGHEVRLQILAINDFHGQIEPYKSSSGAISGGAALMAGYMDAREDAAKLTNTDTWRLGVGDLVGASPAVSGLLQDEPTMQVLDEMDFMYSVVGNHEFDEGLAELYRLQYGGFSAVTGEWDGTRMDYLAANVVDEVTGEPIFPPYVIERNRGVPIGIIGVVYEGTPTIVTASGVAGLEFLPEAATVNKYVAELKGKGVETIIVLLHNGGSGTTSGGTISGDFVPVVAAMDDEVDVVFSGHSHNRYWGYIGSKLVTSAYSAGRAFADVDLVIDRKSGDVISKSAEIVNVLPNAGFEPNIDVAAIVQAALDRVAPIVNEVVGTAASDLSRTQNAGGESRLGNLVADAQRWKQGTQIAVCNPGGIRTDLAAGEVTFGELFAIQPFSNYLVTMTMTGAQIDTMLEQQWVGQGTSIKMLQLSGMRYSWSASAPVGSRVDPASVFVGGAPLDLSATYTVTANNFLAEGGDNFVVFRDALNKTYFGVDLDALVEYVKQLPQPFDSLIEGRANVLP